MFSKSSEIEMFDQKQVYGKNLRFLIMKEKNVQQCILQKIVENTPFNIRMMKLTLINFFKIKFWRF